MKPILEVKKLTMDFGGLRALDHLDIDINQGEIIALIGPNGAGKTTFFNCITGIYTPSKGDIFITPPGKKPERINGLKPNKITEKGIELYKTELARLKLCVLDGESEDLK